MTKEYNDPQKLETMVLEAVQMSFSYQTMIKGLLKGGKNAKV